MMIVMTVITIMIVMIIIILIYIMMMKFAMAVSLVMMAVMKGSLSRHLFTIPPPFRYPATFSLGFVRLEMILDSCRLEMPSTESPLTSPRSSHTEPVFRPRSAIEYRDSDFTKKACSLMMIRRRCGNR